jgi:hypothetical protein
MQNWKNAQYQIAHGRILNVRLMEKEIVPKFGTEKIEK